MSISPIDPDRACKGCGMTPDAWATDTSGCHWPDGQVGCFSGGDENGGTHWCPRCEAKIPKNPDLLLKALEERDEARLAFAESDAAVKALESTLAAERNEHDATRESLATLTQRLADADRTVAAVRAYFAREARGPLDGVAAMLARYGFDEPYRAMAQAHHEAVERIVGERGASVLADLRAVAVAAKYARSWLGSEWEATRNLDAALDRPGVKAALKDKP